MSVLIVGAGQSAISAADSLRRAGYEADITLFGDEADLPYQRPPLSKQALLGDLPFDQLILRGPDYFEKKRISINVSSVVSEIRPAEKTIQTSDGKRHAYDKLLVATGTRPRKLAVEGHTLANIFDLRSLADLRGLMPALHAAQRVVVIGGGFVGLEVAATSRKLGKSVTVIEAADRILARAFTPFMSEWFTDLHRRHGVNLQLGAKVLAFQGKQAVEAVICDSGRHPTDLVVLGIGVLPNQELAAQAGLTCNDGIVVDTSCRTSNADILAAGDCTRHYNAFYDRHIRLESVHNATAQANVAALTIAGQEATYNEVPWFWSDQYNIKLQMIGLSEGHDQVVMRGTPADEKFSAIYLREGIMIAADFANNPLEFVQCRKAIALRRTVNTEQLKNPAFNLAELSK